MFTIPEIIKATKGKLVFAGCGRKVRGISIDSRSLRPGDAFIAIKGDNFDGHDFIPQAIKNGASCIIKVRRAASRCLRTASCIEVKDTIKALGDIASFHRRRFNIPVIAVTGSNGKTTTKDMIAWVLSKRFKVLKNEGTKNNHIGLPMTLLNLNNSHDIAVLEIGTNHFGEVANLARITRPNIGVITNIGLSHLEFLRNLKGVMREKYTLIKNIQAPYLALLNSDDNLLKRKIRKSSKRPFVVSFGIKARADFSASDIRDNKESLSFVVNDKYKFTLPTLGVYNIYNALASTAIATLFGLGYKDIKERLSVFRFPLGRLNLLNLKNTLFIDDTYNSNPLSLACALDALFKFKVDGRRILVMGDMRELGKDQRRLHIQAGRQIAQVCDALITVGELSGLAAKSARTCGFDAKNIFSCENSLQARDILFSKISPDEKDIVLVKGSRAMKMEEVLRI